LPFLRPVLSGSDAASSAHRPCLVGPHGCSVWDGFAARAACRTAPWTSGRCKRGGGVAIALTGCCGRCGALKVCAEALVASAAKIEVINIFIFFLSGETCKFLPVTTPAHII